MRYNKCQNTKSGLLWFTLHQLAPRREPLLCTEYLQFLDHSAPLAWVILPDRDKQDHQEGEDHLHVGQRIHPKGAQDDQLDHLQRCEVVDLPLRHTANVVGGRIRSLHREVGVQNG